MVVSACQEPTTADDRRRPCPPAPGPLEDYAQQFDDLFASLAQRRGFRDYLHGLLLPRERNKTLTGLAGAEPVVGAQHRGSSGCSGSSPSRPGTPRRSTTGGCGCCARTRRPRRMGEGVLVIDETGDRKDGTKTAHVARQYLGSVGKIDNGIVAVTSLWADERVYYPLHVVPYTPAARLPGGRARPGVPDQAAARGGAGRGRRAGRRPVPRGRGRLRLRRARRLRRRRWAPPGCRSCWPSSPARAPGRRPRRRTPRTRRPASSAGAGPQQPGRLAAGRRGASATGTPRPGGRPTPSLAAGGRTGRCGWWWPPPTRRRCPGTAPGTW